MHKIVHNREKLPFAGKKTPLCTISPEKIRYSRLLICNFCPKQPFFGKLARLCMILRRRKFHAAKKFVHNRHNLPAGGNLSELCTNFTYFNSVIFKSAPKQPTRNQRTNHQNVPIVAHKFISHINLA